MKSSFSPPQSLPWRFDVLLLVRVLRRTRGKATSTRTTSCKGELKELRNQTMQLRARVALSDREEAWEKIERLLQLYPYAIELTSDPPQPDTPLNIVSFSKIYHRTTKDMTQFVNYIT